MKRGLSLAGALLATLIVVLVARGLALKSDPPREQASENAAIDEVAASQRLAGALQIPTISVPEAEKRDWRQWLALHRYLAAQFPKVHKNLKREVVAGYSLLFTWPGTDPKLRPTLFLAHEDVVPIAPGTENSWKEAPFAGKISGGFIWGRGALDDKSGLVALLESTEALLTAGYRPKRTLLLAFGHDEEVGGAEGAKSISALLKTRYGEVETVVDEGGFVARGSIPGVKRPVALVGIAEKGYVSIELTASAEGGHSSMPPAKTAIGQLAEAVSRLEKNPLPTSLRTPTRSMLLALGPEMGFSKRVALANLWLFEPLLLRMMAGTPLGNASVRTTTAPTIFQAGIKDNVLPASARAVVNFRLLPGDTPASLLEHVRHTVDNPSIRIDSHVHGEPSPVSDTTVSAFARLKELIQTHFEGAVVAPFLTIASTDTKHYTGLTKNIYRFLPLPLGVEDVARIHGVDERISVADYVGAIHFYRAAIQSLTVD